jgi:hypothetical protein
VLSTTPLEGKYLGDLEARGVPIQRVPTGPVTGATAQMGFTVCDRLRGGSPVETVISQVAHVQLSNDVRFTQPQTEAIVYSAVAHLCPEYAAQVPMLRDRA